MFERSEPALRIACLVLAAVLVFQVVRVIIRHNPVGRMSIPALPALPAATNAATGTKGTNTVSAQVAAKNGTNSFLPGVSNKKEKDTNAAPATSLEKSGTNTVAAVIDSNKMASNAIVTVTPGPVAKKSTNALTSEDFGRMETNSVAVAATLKNGTSATNGTNGTNAINGTNAMVAQASAKGRTNSMPGMPPMGRRGGRFGPGQMGGEKLPDLPPLMQARIDKVVQSEIMAQLTKPQPSGLIGIAGKGAMLRSASGQAGFVKEGGELGGIKLLRVGINRVLVEEDGQKKELMIFEGMGGETLMPKPGETNDTSTKKP